MHRTSVAYRPRGDGTGADPWRSRTGCPCAYLRSLLTVCSNEPQAWWAESAICIVEITELARLSSLPDRCRIPGQGDTHMTSRLSLTLSIVCLMGSVLPAAAQTGPRDEANRDPRLRIDSPRDGAVVTSGETLQVAVSSPNRTRFILGVTVVMTTDSIDDQEAASLPARFAIKIPKSISPGLYGLTAVAGLAGRAGGDGELVGAGIEVDIERREMPRAITAQEPWRQASFEKKGETRQIQLLGDFGNGDVVDVTESSRVTFESSDTAVATVDKTGTITAVGAGHAEVVAWYGPRDKGIKASIPVEAR